MTPESPQAAAAAARPQKNVRLIVDFAAGRIVGVEPSKPVQDSGGDEPAAPASAAA